MDQSRHEQISELFARACKLPVNDREAFLEQACRGDAELKAEIQTLLDRDEKAAGLPATEKLDNKADESLPTTQLESASKPSQDIIEGYRIIETLGEGGMGVVYLAEQGAPLRRKVALKLIKLGMDSKQVIARFESERQALALMDHPNIARVYDAGVTRSGRPYFAMELAKGEPITQYCDRHRLDTRARLELFIQVCEGVQHAHQKGIIHRDIKPSNLLVTIQEEKPVPKIIDFGVAKATRHQLTDTTLHTRMGTLMGTPAYMSPEQAEISDLDIDTRSERGFDQNEMNQLTKEVIRCADELWQPQA